MKVNSIKEIKPSNKLYKKVLAVIISIVVVIASFIYLNNVNNAAKNTIDVVRLKSSDGLAAGSLITEKDIESYSIIHREYTSDMVTYTDKKDVLNKYTTYSLRKKSIIYQEQVTSEKPIKNDWLYKLGNPNNEVLTLTYNYLECGGDILMPGDKIRVRVSKEVTDTAAPGVPGSVPNYNGSTDKRAIKTEVLFDSITVKDLLNSRGHSIYEVYMEVLKLPGDQRETAMKSDDFLNNVQPKSLVLEATPAQVESFSKFKEKGIESFTFTILQRAKEVNILDQLSTVKKEVESWGTKKAN